MYPQETQYWMVTFTFSLILARLLKKCDLSRLYSICDDIISLILYVSFGQLWSEVRVLFPNTFVLIQDVKSHEEGNKLIVKEVTVIKSVDDPKGAWKELFSSKNGRFVYCTSNDVLEIEVKNKPMIRRRRASNPAESRQNSAWRI